MDKANDNTNTGNTNTDSSELPRPTPPTRVIIQYTEMPTACIYLAYRHFEQYCQITKLDIILVDNEVGFDAMLYDTDDMCVGVANYE